MATLVILGDSQQTEGNGIRIAGFVKYNKIMIKHGDILKAYL